MEEELITRWKQGDRAAFDEMYQRYAAKGMRMAYMISGNHADAEDIVQETFVKCFYSITGLKENDKFQSWFYTVLTRTAWRICRKQKREQPQEDISVCLEQVQYAMRDDRKAEYTEQRILQKETAGELRELLEQLPVKQRTTVILYYYNELSTKEIAQVLGCFEGTVKSRLFTARKCLRELYDRRQQKEPIQNKDSILEDSYS